MEPVAGFFDQLSTDNFRSGVVQDEEAEMYYEALTTSTPKSSLMEDKFVAKFHDALSQILAKKSEKSISGPSSSVSQLTERTWGKKLCRCHTPVCLLFPAVAVRGGEVKQHVHCSGVLRDDVQVRRRRR